MMLFPLNSALIYKKYLRKFYATSFSEAKSKRSGTFGPIGPKKPHYPKLETSQDIYHLFETIIF